MPAMGNPAIIGFVGPCKDCEHCRGFRTDCRGTRALCDRMSDGQFWSYLTGCRYWQEAEGGRETMPQDASSEGDQGAQS